MLSRKAYRQPPENFKKNLLPPTETGVARISDVVAAGRAGMKAQHTAGMELHNVQSDAESGPAFLVRDSRDLELDHATTRTPVADSPVVRLDRSPGAIVRASRALEGTGTFLSTGPGELKSIVLEGNVLDSARRR
jgi:hypothetical protein